MVDFLKGMVKPLAATVVVLLAVALSHVQKLGLGGEMVYSIARAFVQLSIIGFVLQFIFTRDNAIWIILAYLFMVIRLSVSVLVYSVFDFYRSSIPFMDLAYVASCPVQFWFFQRSLFLLCSLVKIKTEKVTLFNMVGGSPIFTPTI